MNTKRAVDRQHVSLGSGRFLSLLVTQWLTAINDNAFRWLIVGIAKEYTGVGNEGWVLTAGLALFVLPYLMFAAPAGFLGDRFSKRSVIISCKLAEIVVMLLGVIAIYFGDPDQPMVSVSILFVVVFLMGLQSALFAPSKMGAIPEMLPAEKISAANGWFGLSTVTATMIGMGIGGWLAVETQDYGQGKLWLSAIVLLGIAIVGTGFSFGIPKLRVANPQRRFPWNAPRQTMADLRLLFGSGFLLMMALGKVFFWSAAALAQLNIDQFVFESGAFVESERTPLLIMLVLGVGVGSVIAGLWSCGRIELGILPFASLGIIVFALLTSRVSSEVFNTGQEISLPLIQSSLTLLMLGVASGMLDVPLGSYLQHRSPTKSRAAILSAVNFLIFTGMLIASLAFLVMRLPYYEGSLANLPKDLQTERHSEEELREIELLANEYETAWATATKSEHPDLKEFLEKGDDSENHELLARLLWIEFNQLTKMGVPPLKADYFDAFPNDKRLVKEIYVQAGGLPLLSSRDIFVVLAMLTAPVFLYTVWRLPQPTVRFTLWNLLRCLVKIEVRGIGNVSSRKAAVVVANQASFLDRLLLLMVTPRVIHWVTWHDRAKHRSLRRWEDFWKIIRIAGGPNAKQTQSALARKTILNGGMIAVFPERGDRYDDLDKVVQEELLMIVSGINVPILPVYFDHSLSSVSGSRQVGMFGKLWRLRGKKIVVRFGKPIEKQPNVISLHRIVAKLGVKSVNEQFPEFKPPIRSFIEQCKKRKFDFKVGDSAGTKLTGGKLLTNTLVLRSLLNQHLLDDDEKYVGVLLPPSVPGFAVNMALSADKRIPVNLNYSVSAEVMNECNALCGVKHVLTSRRVMDKLKLDLDAEVVFLEDLREKKTKGQILSGLWNAFMVSSTRLSKKLGLNEVQSDDELTVIFTSGSTGTPKGVMLTQRNVQSNFEAVRIVADLKHEDCLIGILPFFHSMGYTITMWGVAGLDISGVFHFSPIDAKQIGKLTKQHEASCLISTPTFLRGLMRRCKPEELQTLDVVVAGAEKLPTDLCDAFEKKFSVRPVEGYGATELSPLVSVNIPPSRSRDDGLVDIKEGSVGQPISLVETKVTDIDSGEVLGKNEPGMLWIKGPNVMKGYFKRKDLTDEVVVDGWYKTGDVAKVDDDGFIIITDRASRFSKIGGEMVPHIKVEELLNQIIGVDEEVGIKAAVTAVPDEKKGERLIVVHLPLEQPPSDLCKELSLNGLPNIFIPSVDSFHEIESMPVLGSGKLDLKGLKQIAVDAFGK